MEQKTITPVQGNTPKKDVYPTYWWNERHLTVLFVLGLAVTVYLNGW